MVVCSQPECINEIPDHAWGKVKAGGIGWFFERNGRSWCPIHTPEWVATWRNNSNNMEN